MEASTRRKSSRRARRGAHAAADARLETALADNEVHDKAGNVAPRAIEELDVRPVTTATDGSARSTTLAGIARRGRRDEREALATIGSEASIDRAASAEEIVPSVDSARTVERGRSEEIGRIARSEETERSDSSVAIEARTVGIPAASSSHEESDRSSVHIEVAARGVTTAVSKISTRRLSTCTGQRDRTSSTEQIQTLSPVVKVAALVADARKVVNALSETELEAVVHHGAVHPA